MTRKRNRVLAPKSQEQLEHIVDELKLSENERIKLLCWLPRALQAYHNLKREQTDRLTVRQRLEKLEALRDCAETLNNLLGDLGSGAMISYEQRQLLDKGLTEQQMTEGFAEADARVMGEFCAVRALGGRTKSMLLAEQHAQSEPQQNSAKPALDFLTRESVNYWHMHLKNSGVSLTELVVAMYKAAGDEVGSRGLYNRLEGVVPRSRVSPQPAPPELAPVIDTPAAWRSALIAELVEVGYDEETAREIAADQKYEDIDPSVAPREAARKEFLQDR